MAKIPADNIRPVFTRNPFGLKLAQLLLTRDGQTIDLMTLTVNEEQAIWIEEYCQLTSQVVALAAAPARRRKLPHLLRERHEEALEAM